ncbi:phosphatase PAP2 family protein [Mastigocladopsis repens]|uniref:phosphatase PAP2 family protein n=1 Tax=Mastigocladopsis repens TaxID=221287 RepID=UPI0003040222|nr:phosphatase PAP2 family protein [Mastigocladopsis repens]
MFNTDLSKLIQSFLEFSKKLLVARWDSLLLLLIGVYLPLQIFGLLAVEVWKNEGGFPWDVPILVAIHSTARTQLDVIAVTLTHFGSKWFVFPVVAVIGLVLFIQRRWRSLTYLLTTEIGSAIINRTAKEFMHRVRPQIWESLAPELDFSFPSGHSMTSMTLVAALVILTWGSIWCWLVLIVGSAFVLAIGWTRLYLGVHFPSDILAGWMVSIAWAIGVSVIIRPHLTKVNIVSETPAAEETTLLPEETQLIGED